MCKLQRGEKKNASLFLFDKSKELEKSVKLQSGIPQQEESVTNALFSCAWSDNIFHIIDMAFDCNVVWGCFVEMSRSGKSFVAKLSNQQVAVNIHRQRIAAEQHRKMFEWTSGLFQTVDKN